MELLLFLFFATLADYGILSSLSVSYSGFLWYGKEDNLTSYSHLPSTVTPLENKAGIQLNPVPENKLNPSLSWLWISRLRLWAILVLVFYETVGIVLGLPTVSLERKLENYLRLLKKATACMPDTLCLFQIVSLDPNRSCRGDICPNYKANTCPVDQPRENEVI